MKDKRLIPIQEKDDQLSISNIQKDLDVLNLQKQIDVLNTRISKIEKLLINIEKLLGGKYVD